MALELFVYYRVPADARDAALREVQQRQAALSGHRPGLAARLLWRADAADHGTLTCMETYTHPLGIDEALCSHIEASMADCPAHRAGPRHVERFIACSSGGDRDRHRPDR